MKKAKAMAALIGNICAKTGLTFHALAAVLNVDIRSIMRWANGGTPSNGAMAALIAIDRSITESKDLKVLNRKLRLLAACGGMSFLLYRTLNAQTDALQKELLEGLREELGS